MKNNFAEKLAKLKEQNLYRELKTYDLEDKKVISFACNDYFCLSQNEEVKKAAILATEKYGAGARASRYVTGNNNLYSKLEQKIAKIKNCDDAIVFGSGYLTAIGIIPALVEKGDLIVADRLIHSSLIDGAKLSNAKILRFKHNNLAHCEEILKQNRHLFKKCLLITETVFSMDGDVGKIPELLQLAKKYDCLLISDDAHGLGLVEFDVEKNQQNYLQIGTLSKAVGTYGGYVAGDKIIIDYLRNFAKSAIYSTALPPAVLASAIASLEIIKKENLKKKLLENANYFCSLLNLPKAESAIVVIIIGDNKKVVEIANKTLEKGFLISAIRPPTVEKGKARLRITFKSDHKKDDIYQLAQIIKDLVN